MTLKRSLPIVAGIGILGLLAWGVSSVLDRVFNPTPATPAGTATAAPAPTAHITATLFYGAPDGQGLVAVRREVPLAAGIVEQGRQILTMQLQDAPAPHVSAIPKGTSLRAFYVTPSGDAFVDVSKEIVAAHGGGSLGELLTVYAIVNAVTANLPAVQRVQILVDGAEVDTIAGHVDIRRPLERDASLVRP